MQKKLMYLEIAGIIFIVIMSVFMQNLLDLSGHTLIGVMFGSVNDSIWEIEKTLLFPYLFMGGNRTFMYKNSVSQIYCRKGGFPLVFSAFHIRQYACCILSQVRKPTFCPNLPPHSFAVL